MATGARMVSLFLVMAGIGFGGDYMVGLLADDDPSPGQVFVVDVAEPEVDVKVDVHVRHSGRCEFEAERTVTLDVSAAEWLELNAGSGELAVEGRAGLDRVQAVGRACASTAALLEELRLTLERVGDEVVLTAHYPEGRRRGYARIDLAVEVPLGMPVDLHDSSGSLEVSGTGALNIDDSSGGIIVRGVNGSVSVDDSSGGMELSDIAGDLTISDGSGGIDVRDVEGNVRIRDGSGSIEVDEVGRNVVVDADGSGSIRVRDVLGDFTVRADGSGSIRHSGVAGSVDIPRDKRARNRGS